jgi:maltooligosyltrehalose trehalohydrolase
MRLDVGLGATYLGDGRCRFCVWAPLAGRVDVHVVAPQERWIPLEANDLGYHEATAEGVNPGSLYSYRLDAAKEHPDPASRFQPEGVHGPSQVVDGQFKWEDGRWSGLRLEDYIIYEIHVGAFTDEGTFDAVIGHLDELKELGATAVELMPVAQFPGTRNWGYDGVFPFAVQHSYGGPEGLKRLVNSCHRVGLAVVLDVVYNHVGPEGNYLDEFGPYFTERYRTPWGCALNFDGPASDEVRRFFIENALYWTTEFHIDALRLDALHAILDISPRPFLEELASRVHERGQLLGRPVYLFGESDLNDARLVRSAAKGGSGLDALWNDDFHHCLHVLLTGERMGYYEDFGRLRQLVKAFQEGFVYSGEYSPYRQRRHGISSRDVPGQQLVVFAQNHDQVGNRMMGERLSQLVSFDALKLAAGIVLLSPFVPLLFMGEEYGEMASFQYFVDHSDRALIEAVRCGRREEFAAFSWQGDLPDPQDAGTFQRAKMDRLLKHQGRNAALLAFYKELIRLRKETQALSNLSKDTLEALGYEEQKVLFLRRWSGEDEAIMVFNFGDAQVSIPLPVPPGQWHKRLDSAEEQWHGEGSSLPVQLHSKGTAVMSLGPKAFAVFNRIRET